MFVTVTPRRHTGDCGRRRASTRRPSRVTTALHLADALEPSCPIPSSPSILILELVRPESSRVAAVRRVGHGCRPASIRRTLSCAASPSTHSDHPRARPSPYSDESSRRSPRPPLQFTGASPLRRRPSSRPPSAPNRAVVSSSQPPPTLRPPPRPNPHPPSPFCLAPPRNAPPPSLRTPPELPAPARGPLPRAPRPLGFPEAHAARSRRRLAPQWPERRRRRRAAAPSRARRHCRPCAARPCPAPAPRPRLPFWPWRPAAVPLAGPRQRKPRCGPVSAAPAMAAQARAKQGRRSSWAGAHCQVGPGCQPHPFFMFSKFYLFS